MKAFILSLIVLLFLSCKENRRSPNTNTSSADTITKHDTIYLSPDGDWQKSFGLTHDSDVDSVWHKSVKFYTNDPMCSGLAIDFYYGFLRPSDNGTTDELLKLAATNNSKLRPFYRWCLNKTIQISDGALAEHVGEPARQYSEKYPKEFFEYMAADTSNARYVQWTSAINYSGYYENEDYRNKNQIMSNIIKAMKSNCGGCDEEMHRKIEQFAKDCFSSVKDE